MVRFLMQCDANPVGEHAAACLAYRLSPQLHKHIRFVRVMPAPSLLHV